MYSVSFLAQTMANSEIMLEFVKTILFNRAANNFPQVLLPICSNNVASYILQETKHFNNFGSMAGILSSLHWFTENSVFLDMLDTLYLFLKQFCYN